MAGGDAGLEMVFAERVASCGERDVVNAAPDYGLIPSGAVLLAETEEIAGVVRARGEAGGVEQQERGPEFNLTRRRSRN